jgi:hypothetical protein
MYEPNPKHKEPWQRGRRGSLCPPMEDGAAQELLGGSDLEGGKRFACREGKAYCAQEHLPGRWHGYPVGWREVPPKLRGKWLEKGIVSRADMRRHWEGHS